MSTPDGRGPLWMPVNYLLIESLQKFHHYYGPDFKVECPSGSGHLMTLLEASDEIARRILSLFVRDESGSRAVFGDHAKLQNDPHSATTCCSTNTSTATPGAASAPPIRPGWTGLVAKLIQPRRTR